MKRRSGSRRDSGAHDFLRLDCKGYKGFVTFVTMKLFSIISLLSVMMIAGTSGTEGGVGFTQPLAVVFFKNHTTALQLSTCKLLNLNLLRRSAVKMISEEAAANEVPSSGTTQSSGVWGNLKWAGWKVYGVMDAAGEYVADMLGLKDSHYQWVIDEYMKRKEEEEDIAAEAEAEERARVEELEEGEGET